MRFRGPKCTDTLPQELKKPRVAELFQFTFYVVFILRFLVLDDEPFVLSVFVSFLLLVPCKVYEKRRSRQQLQ